MTDIVLLHSPLVGPHSLEPLRDALAGAGDRCFLPSPPDRQSREPAWREWPAILLEQLPALESPIVIGHSMAGLLAARLAAEFDGAAMICLDANMPPAEGPTPPIDPGFRGFMETLPATDGVLPPWHRWWPNDVFEGVPVDPELRERIEAEIPALPLSWFDDAFDMPDWSAADRAFIRLGAWFDEEANRAEAAGWPVVRIEGTHLHPSSRPKETAATIRQAIGAMGR